MAQCPRGGVLRMEAYAIAVLVRVGLRVLTLPRLSGLLAGLPRARDGASERACLAAATMAAGGAAHPTCLFTSLIGFALLARRGRDVRLHLGVARTPGFEAHAWLTSASVPLEPVPTTRYTPIWHRAAYPELP